MERETKKINLPKSKLEIEVKTYFNVGEKRDLQKVLFSGKGLEDLDDNNIPIDRLHIYQDKLIELGVTRFNGKSGEFVKLSNELKDDEDFRFIIESLSKLTNTEKKS